MSYSVGTTEPVPMEICADGMYTRDHSPGHVEQTMNAEDLASDMMDTREDETYDGERYPGYSGRESDNQMTNGPTEDSGEMDGITGSDAILYDSIATTPPMYQRPEMFHNFDHRSNMGPLPSQEAEASSARHDNQTEIDVPMPDADASSHEEVRTIKFTIEVTISPASF
ncbi:hypothetical protein AAWM_02242 [Aspergillus awamori]|uniref:Uncharacterized protein n=1 Tax=Aspergillus awamori TaxID=105351 RepID=A0A401KJ96_ASPAW|nr:hypothetical protein AAWM_02242 [Aspergillus awamori]